MKTRCDTHDLMRAPEVCRRLKVEEVDGGKWVLHGEVAESMDGKILDWHQLSEPLDPRDVTYTIDGRVWKRPRMLRTLLRSEFPAPFEVKERFSGGWYVSHRDEGMRFLVEGSVVRVTDCEEVLEMEREAIREQERRARWWWIAFLLVGTVVACVGGLVLLFFGAFIYAFVKEVL